MTITICGSMRFAKEMDIWQQKLSAQGFEVYVPGGLEDIKSYEEAVNPQESTKRKLDNDHINLHYKDIKQSEAILVLNYEKNNIPNYVGGNSLMEMGFAFTQNKDIFLINPIPEQSYSAEINAMQPIIINEDVQIIVDHFNSLPTVVLSSENLLKIKATSLALREYNLRYKVIGFKTKSDISEQPFSIEETYLGAKNRLIDLNEKGKEINPTLYVSIESGNEKLLKDHNYFALSVCIVSDGKKQVMTTLSDLEFPKEMTDLVPEVYPDLGILIQEKYGSKTKDPYLFITNGKLSRQKTLFDLVVNTLALL